MKKFLLFSLALAAALLVAAPVLAQMSINGAGATFPAPLYIKWAYKYNQDKGVKVNYQAIGSGGGIAQIKAKTVDFGGTDEPQKPDFLKEHGIYQFPTVVGGEVAAFNLKGIQAGQLVLDGPTLAKIYLGEITKWNDPAMKKLNPKLNLPDKDITVVHRSDGSGTTFIFTSYLADVSPEFKAKVGVGKEMNWPGKNSVGAKGNSGVAGQVQNIDGAIGYVEYAYAAQNKMAYANMINKAGKVVKPTLESFGAAAANADWKNAPYGYGIDLINEPGDNSWPIVGATYIMIYKDQADAAKGKAVLDFFAWAFKNGGDIARELHYVVLPDSIVKMVEADWAKEITSGGKPIYKK
jgi:phosphate transport system substrate-binding protein|uniref:Phosphate-binding protein n=1 Tax=Desulfobacca acetoxidans TaxID=60893 RepID=A0A7V6A606_9BACT